jgi:hypothetical protein
VSTKLQQIAEQAVENPERVFTSLIHQIDEDFLKEAYRRTNKQAAPGREDGKRICGQPGRKPKDLTRADAERPV